MMDEPHYMITVSVRHSQKLSVHPAKPWVAVKQSGTVVCAHCSCMAGLGEACSHIAALLFTLEANTKMKKTPHVPHYHAHGYHQHSKMCLMLSFPTLTLQLQTLKGEKRTAWLSLHWITVGEQANTRGTWFIIHNFVCSWKACDSLNYSWIFRFLCSSLHERSHPKTIDHPSFTSPNT